MKRKKEIKRKVRRVIDGDTFEVYKSVGGTHRIRIARKNAPERGHPGYEAAKKNLARKIHGRTLTIRPVGRSYDRLVAEVPFVRRKRRRG